MMRIKHPRSFPATQQANWAGFEQD